MPKKAKEKNLKKKTAVGVAELQLKRLAANAARREAHRLSRGMPSGDGLVIQPLSDGPGPSGQEPGVCDIYSAVRHETQAVRKDCDSVSESLKPTNKENATSSCFEEQSVSITLPLVSGLSLNSAESIAICPRIRDVLQPGGKQSITVLRPVTGCMFSSVFRQNDCPVSVVSRMTLHEDGTNDCQTVIVQRSSLSTAPYQRPPVSREALWERTASTSHPEDNRGRPPEGVQQLKVFLKGKKGRPVKRKLKNVKKTAKVAGCKKRKKGERTTRKKKSVLEQIPLQPAVLKPIKSCRFCHAKKFKYESSTFCCVRGEVSLDVSEPPPELADLFFGTSPESLSFQRFLRPYNNAVAFTSLGIHYDEKLANSIGTGVYCFKVQGQVHHYINPLVPTRKGPAFLQLYYYDPVNELENRTRICSGFNTSIMQRLMQVLRANPYARFFRSLHDIPDLANVTIVIRGDPSLDQNVYNRPTVDDVATIWSDPEDPYDVGRRNIVVHGYASHSYNVNYHYGCYDPLQYPLFHPFGEPGWHRAIERKVGCRNGGACVGQKIVEPRNVDDPETLMEMEAEVYARGGHGRGKYVTVREYYAYLFQIRPKHRSLILHGKRLLQQFVVDMYVKLETQRLDYLRHNQKQLRSELYQGIIESIAVGETDAAKVGKRVILPASFIGGPRDLRRRYLDAMALVREFGKPDIFLTMTCNPGWSEIQSELERGQTYQDRPDVVARIFRAKFEQLKDDILKKQILGEVAAYVFVIEFQKRGLPHAHVLLILKHDQKLMTVDSYDKIVTAEIPDPQLQPYLHSIVKKHMMHGPCGPMKPDNSCMTDRASCKYGYPKNFQADTIVGANEYPLYRRPENGRTVVVRGHRLDNRWVVPYCPYLLAKYNCHLNVEICSTIQAVKYLYKYIYKGHDRVAFCVASDENAPKLDEIELYQQGRWVSPVEAMWRIFGFRMYGVYPPVLPLYVHLPDKQSINFSQQSNLMGVVENENVGRTMLTEFFETNKRLRNQKSPVHLYREFARYYRWDRMKKKWFKRAARPNVGRLHVVSPLEGERYYLRVLLSNIAGPVSFEELKSVNGVILPSFKAAAVANGFVKPDDTVERCLEEASLYQMPAQLRDMFASLLVHFNPTDVHGLWEKFKHVMSEDFLHEQRDTGIDVEAKVLFCIGSYLDGMGKKLEDYGLLLPEGGIDFGVDGREVHDELHIPVAASDLAAITMLNSSQLEAFTVIMDAVQNRLAKAFFVDGPGGTGKTFLYRCLLAAVRSKKEVALATASSGVAASLLPGGRTAHSRFKLPFDQDGSPVCHVSKQSDLGKLIRTARLIIWDEAVMAHKNSIHSFDAMLRDLMGNDLLFGGKVVVFGGDFRQTLPVVINGTKEDTINASILTSPLWDSLAVIRLTENMRARSDPAFCEYLMNVGDGGEPTTIDAISQIPESMLIKANDAEEGLQKLTDFVFPGLNKYNAESMFAQNNAILTPRNKTVDLINEKLLEQYPGLVCKYKSFDCVTDPNQQGQYEDLLHTFVPNGMPSHELNLKIDSPVMLLRNINPSRGLCNGTRLICRKFDRNVITADIANGDRKGERVFIHRIPFCSAATNLFPVSFERVQFPLRLCFAMTINKSQGQTLDKVGLYLPQRVFSHGQLYVALSRAKLSASVKVFLAHAFDEETSKNCTTNVVYKEVLRCIATVDSAVQH